MSTLSNQHGIGEYDAEAAGKLKHEPLVIRDRDFQDLRNEQQLLSYREIQVRMVDAKIHLLRLKRWRRERARIVSDHFLPAFLRRQAE